MYRSPIYSSVSRSSAMTSITSNSCFMGRSYFETLVTTSNMCIPIRSSNFFLLVKKEQRIGKEGGEDGDSGADHGHVKVVLRLEVRQELPKGDVPHVHV